MGAATTGVKSRQLLIVDDHQPARAALRNLLSDARGLQVVGEASDGGEALTLCRQTRPDLVLVDLQMRHVDGLTFTRAVKQESPSNKVVIVTMDRSPRRHLEAFSCGADGLVLKGAPKREFLRVLRGVLAADPTPRLELTAQILGWLAARINSPDGASPMLLTPRQATVVRLLASGRGARATARSLHVNVSTIVADVEDIVSTAMTRKLSIDGSV